MRWPGANLEEKHEPRGVSVAEAQNGDSMKSSRRNLTLAAIEKRSLVAGYADGKKRPTAAYFRTVKDGPPSPEADNLSIAESARPLLRVAVIEAAIRREVPPWVRQQS